MNKKTQELAALSSDAQMQNQLIVEKKGQLQINEEILGKGAVFDLDQLVNQIHGHLLTANIAMYEVGKCLTALKNNMSPSAYRDVLQNRIGTEARYAQRAIRIYDRFKSGRRPELVAQMNQAQLLVLMYEPDDALDELAEGGALTGMDKDDLLNLSANEMRAQLRKARIKLAEGKETLDMMMQKNSERTRELEKAADLGPKYSALPKELLADVARECAALCAAASTIKARVQQFVQMVDVEEHDVPDETRDMLKSMVKNAEKAASELIGLVG